MGALLMEDALARPATDIRDRVLVAARTTFTQVGVEAASLREIARVARTSPAMIGYWFESKDGLFRAVIDDVYDRFLSDMREIAEAEPDPLERLRCLLSRMARASTEELATFLIVVREATVRSERVGYVIGRFLQGHGALLQAALMEAQERGQVREFPLPMTVPLLVAPILFPQLLANLLGDAAGPFFADLPAVAMQLVFEGLLPRAGTGDGNESPG